MKIIFLDFDGVLNSEEFMIEADLWEIEDPATMVNEKAVEKLNKIIMETGAKVVISSSWRYYLSLEKIIEILNGKNFIGEVIGKTRNPWINSQHLKHIEPKEFDKDHYHKFRGVYSNRGHEIQDWLDTNKNLSVEKIVILDDNRDMEHLIPNLVQTTWLCGMNDLHVEKAIKMLNEDNLP